MSDHAEFPSGRRRFTAVAAVAAFAAGLAAALAGAWLLRPVPTPAPEPPSAAATAMPSPAASAATVPTSLADVVRLTSSFDRNLALYRLAAGLDAAGVERLLAEAAALERASERDPATRILYARYLELDPEATLRHVLAGGVAAERWLQPVFDLWARTDLDAAVRHAQTLNAIQRFGAAAAILQARSDLPRAKAAEIVALLAPEHEHILQTVTAGRSLADDPTRAWRQALARNPGPARNQALTHVAIRWGSTDPRTALGAIESASDVDQRTRDELRGTVMYVWADADPAAAMDWVMAQPASQSRTDMVGSVLQAWADAAPRAAAAWMNVPENRAAIPSWVPGSVTRSYAARHPEDALDWLLALPPAAGSERMFTAFSVLAQNDPDRAVHLLQRVEDADARRQATHGLVYGWAETDPVAAMAWLNRLGDTDPAERDRLTPSLLVRWAETDVAAAIGHLDRLTEPQLRDGAIVAILDAVLRYDVSLAETLFDRLEDEDAREEAARKLHDHLSKTDPDRAERYR